MDVPDDVTRLLIQWREGDPGALDRLIPIVYDELRAIARRHLSREKGGQLIQATQLVHETYLRLIDQRYANFQNRSHFLAVAANLIRRILIDHARSSAAAKRGPGLNLSLSEISEPPSSSPAPLDAASLIDLDGALHQLEQRFPGKARLVELRYFGGLTIEETAEVLNLSPSTVKRDWLTAKAYLAKTMEQGRSASLLSQSSPHEPHSFH